MEIQLNSLETQKVYDQARKIFPEGKLEILTKTWLAKNTIPMHYVEVKTGKFLVECAIVRSKSLALSEIYASISSKNYCKPTY